MRDKFKLIDEFQSQWEGKADADLHSVISTSKIKEEEGFENLINLTG